MAVFLPIQIISYKTTWRWNHIIKCNIHVYIVRTRLIFMTQNSQWIISTMYFPHIGSWVNSFNIKYNVIGCTGCKRYSTTLVVMNVLPNQPWIDTPNNICWIYLGLSIFTVHQVSFNSWFTHIETPTILSNIYVDADAHFRQKQYYQYRHRYHDFPLIIKRNM